MERAVENIEISVLFQHWTNTNVSPESKDIFNTAFQMFFYFP